MPTAKTPPTVTIDRRRWRSGGQSVHKVGVGAARLLNASGYMCCLGFACRQLDDTVKVRDIRDVMLPHILGKRIPRLTRKFNNFYGMTNTKFAEQAARINDDSCITTTNRERQLTALFKRNGIKLVFAGEYRKKDQNT